MSVSGDIGSGKKELAMNANHEKLEGLAKDLRREEPRAAYDKLGGFEMAARTLDKCRASLLGIEGDFRFGCPMDEEFFHEAGIEKEQFETFVATGATDEEVASWIKRQAHSAP